jgi:toxin-antitoxin system PIN domain toxin
LILVDAYLLLYAHVSDFPQHEPAREWLDSRLNGLARVAMPWPSLLGFLRIATNPRVFARPEPIDSAWRQVAEWLSVPLVWIPLPTERHSSVLGELLTGGRASGNLVSDAHLAALAIEHGLTLCSTDGDFARFPALRWENPIAS